MDNARSGLHQQSKARGKRYKLVTPTGCFLLVLPSGGRLWRLKYRQDDHEKKLSIGTQS